MVEETPLDIANQAIGFFDTIFNLIPETHRHIQLEQENG